MADNKSADRVIDVETDNGCARLTWHAGLPRRPTGILLLGHGAGGGITAPDLLLVAGLSVDLGMAVGLVEQPYRVAGKRAPAPATKLDVSFTTVAEVARRQVKAAGSPDAALVTGGRSSGARVACRTAAAVHAAGVLALAFPLLPPRERPSRLPELLGAGVPTFVVQGERDSFGSDVLLRTQLTTAGCGGQIIVSTAVGADHALRKGIDGPAITEWLARFLP